VRLKCSPPREARGGAGEGARRGRNEARRGGTIPVWESAKADFGPLLPRSRGFIRPGRDAGHIELKQDHSHLARHQIFSQHTSSIRMATVTSSPAKSRPRPAEAPQAPPPDAARYVRAFRAIAGLAFLASLALSYPLWVGSRDYPLVPLIPGLQLPAPLDAVLFGAMCLALLGAALLPRPNRFLVAVPAIGVVWAVLDQSRWQPYLAWYLTAAVCLLLAERSPTASGMKQAAEWALAPVQLLTCCMYVYSGLHKLNHHYLTTDFILTVRPLLGWLHVTPSTLPAGAVHGAALASALAELGLGALLMAPRGRRAAVIGLTAIHAFILLMIGPLGAGWNRVVWPWNVAAVAALWLLFWPAAPYERLRAFVRAWWKRDGAGKRGAAAAVPRPQRLAWNAVLVLFGAMPALSFVGLWPASLSFRLYAGKERIALIYYDAKQPGALPPAALAASRAPGEVNLLAWSQAELNAAPVMDDRVLLGIGRSLARRSPAGVVGLLIASEPALLTGRRTTRFFVFRGPALEPVDASAEYTVELHEDTGAR